MSRGSDVPLPGGEGSIRGSTTGTGRPVTSRKEPHPLDPITGFSVPFSDLRASRGEWTGSLGQDERGYKDREYDLRPAPLPQHFNRRTRPKPDPRFGE